MIYYDPQKYFVFVLLVIPVHSQGLWFDVWVQSMYSAESKCIFFSVLMKYAMLWLEWHISAHTCVCVCACHKFTHSHVEGTKSMLVALLHDDDGGGGGGDLFISRNILFSLALHSANSPMRQWSHKRSLKTDVKSPLKSTPNRTSHLTADKVVIDFIFYRCLGGGEDSGPSWLLFWWFGAGLCCVFVTK